MYSGRGFKDWEIGDVEVFVHDGVYHLFHLIIPNHDYIAHAISKDGVNWKRVKNALFVGDPGDWDDDMLWTMDVSECDGGFEMFYTGLSMEEEGRIQKVGRAFSSDLYHWEKDENFDIIESSGPHYEDPENNPRGWISFRDPYKYIIGEDIYLLICARASDGPIHRRGCVGLIKMKNDNHESLPALLYPAVYDDVECPCLIELKGRYYLIGSIREDIKVRYWHSMEFEGPYESFHSDMLMPGGNYAARIVNANGKHLLYNFYFSNKDIYHKRVLPPPKELEVDEHGRLYMLSWSGWKDKIEDTIIQSTFPDIHPRLSNPTSEFEINDKRWVLSSKSGYQIYTFKKPSDNYIWEGKLMMEGMGKGGFIINGDEEGNGYYLSLDFVNGYVKIRKWGFNYSDMANDFIFEKLQSNLFKPNQEPIVHFRLISYGHYLEFSIDGKVKLTLVDDFFDGPTIGFYVASATLALEDSSIKTLMDPKSSYVTEI